MSRRGISQDGKLSKMGGYRTRGEIPPPLTLCSWQQK